MGMNDLGTTQSDLRMGCNSGSATGSGEDTTNTGTHASTSTATPPLSRRQSALVSNYIQIHLRHWVTPIVSKSLVWQEIEGGGEERKYGVKRGFADVFDHQGSVRYWHRDIPKEIKVDTRA